MIKPHCQREKLSTILPDDDFHYDAVVIFNSKSTNDMRLVLEMLENLEGEDYHLQPIKLGEPDGRVSKKDLTNKADPLPNALDCPPFVSGKATSNFRFKNISSELLFHSQQDSDTE